MNHAHTKVYLALMWHETGHMQGIDRYACEKNWTVEQSHPNPVEELRQFRPHGIISQLMNLPEAAMVKAVKAVRVPMVDLCITHVGMHVPR